jgi:hypothetical protein
MARTQPRGKPQPKPKAQEPSQSPNLILIVFLSLSMVINVALGVMMYLDRGTAAQAVVAKKTAEDNAKLEQNRFKLIRNFFLAKFRAIVGDTQLGQPERDEMKALNEEALKLVAEDESLKTWYKNLMLKLAGDPHSKTAAEKAGMVGPMVDPKDGEGFVGGTPQYTFASRLAALQSEVSSLRQQLTAKTQDFDKIKDEYTKYQELWNAKKTEDAVRVAQTRADEDLKKRLDELNQAIGKYKEEYDKLEKEATAALRKEKDRYQGEMDRREQAFKDRVRELEQEVKNELRKLQSQQVVTTNEPRGEIVRIEQNGQVVFINIGSNARVPAKLPFVVYGRGPGGSARPVPKAKIEVIQTVGPDVAMARVLEIRKVDAPYDANTGDDFNADRNNWVTEPRDFWMARNPLTKGDLLFNPAWDPRRQVRVYLAGPFDLDGDGRDDVREVERLLQSYGVKVDGFLDPNTNYTPTGLLQYRTDFVVIGDVPEVLADAKPGQEAKRAQGNEMLTQIGKITGEAKEKGVEVISWKRFFARVGYSPSRLPSAGPGSGASGVGGRGYVGVTK